MQKTQLIRALFITTAALGSSVLFAQSTSSVANIPGNSGHSLSDDIYLNFFSIYHGAPVKDPGSAYTLNKMGLVNTQYKSNFDSEVTAAYLINHDIGVGPDIPFLIVPAEGNHMVLGDAGVKIFDRKTVQSIEGFNLYTNLIVQAPTSDYSKARGMGLALKTTPSVRYWFPHNNFAIGTWTEAKSYLGVTSGKAFKLYAAPYVNYALSDRFALNLEYEMEADHYVGKPNFDFTNYQTDLQPGFIWGITKHIFVNPYIQLFTGNQISLDHSALGAIINATLL